MKKKKIILSGVFVGLAIITIWGISAGKQARQVSMGDVLKGDLSTYVEETAVVRLKNETSIFALQGGRITKIAKPSDKVKQGDLLVQLDDTELALQIKSLQAQKQAVAAQYEEAGRTNSEKINQLGILLDTAKITYNEAKRALDNVKALYDAGYTSYDEYQAAVSAFARADAGVKTAESNLSIEQEGISESVRRQYEAQLAEVSAQIDICTKKYEDSSIKAPFDGIVLKKTVDEGSTVLPGTVLLQYGDNQGFFLESSILTDEIKGIQVGTAVLISNEDLGIQDIKGTVSSISPVAISELSELGIAQKKVEIEITLSEDIPNIMSGYEMDIKIVTNSKKDVLTVDKKAVFDYHGQSHVFINDNGVAKLSPVKTGLEDDERVEVIEGLKEGDQVILSPEEDLEEGMKIQKI